MIRIATAAVAKSATTFCARRCQFVANDFAGIAMNEIALVPVAYRLMPAAPHGTLRPARK